jgi:hypothetical protein
MQKTGKHLPAEQKPVRLCLRADNKRMHNAGAKKLKHNKGNDAISLRAATASCQSSCALAPRERA